MKLVAVALALLMTPQPTLAMRASDDQTQRGISQVNTSRSTLEQDTTGFTNLGVGWCAGGGKLTKGNCGYNLDNADGWYAPSVASATTIDGVNSKWNGKYATCMKK